jgi:hypothetical protein
MALRRSNLWNLDISLKALGRSATSAFSSLYHFFHYKESISNDEQILAKVGSYSRALIFYHIFSVKKFLRTSGIGGALSSVFPRIRWLTSTSLNLPYLTRILSASMVDTIILCFSNNPLLQYLNEVRVIESII